MKTNGHKQDLSPRLSIRLTQQLRTSIDDAAKRANSDVSTWSLAQLVRAAGASGTDGAPIVLSGKVADRVRALALAQGVTPERAIELAIVGG